MKNNPLKKLSILSLAIAFSAVSVAAYADDPAPSNPLSGAGLTEAQFNAWFGQANSVGYTYQSLVDAFNKYPVFSPNESTIQKIYMLAGFLANAAHESGDFKYTTECLFTGPNCAGVLKPDSDGSLMRRCQTAYNDGPNLPPVGSSVCFYGRGALQLSHNYNYKAYDASAPGVYNNPDLFLGSGPPNFTKNLFMDSAVWFWSDASTVLQQNRPMDGFKADPSTYSSTNDPLGNAINVINGGIECHAAPGSVGAQEAQDRVTRFLSYVSQLAKNAGVTAELNAKYNSADTVGVTCTAPPPPPPPPTPPPAGAANYLVIDYIKGDWATIQCVFTDPNNPIKINLPQTVYVAGTEQDPRNLPVSCQLTLSDNVIFNYNSGVWTSNNANASCKVTKDAALNPYSLCSIPATQSQAKSKQAK